VPVTSSNSTGICMKALADETTCDDP